MEDRYTEQLTARVGRDLRTHEKYLLAVPLLAPSFTLNVTVLAAVATGLGTLAVAGSGLPAWIGAAVGVVVGVATGILVTRRRMRSSPTSVIRSGAVMFVLAVTDRRFIVYRRTVGNQARELLVDLARQEVASVEVARGTFLRPRPVTLRLRDGTTLQFEGARADSVSRLPGVSTSPDDTGR